MTRDLATLARTNRLIALARLADRRHGRDPAKISRLRRPLDERTVDLVFASVRKQQPMTLQPYSLAA